MDFHDLKDLLNKKCIGLVIITDGSIMLLNNNFAENLNINAKKVQKTSLISNATR